MKNLMKYFEKMEARRLLLEYIAGIWITQNVVCVLLIPITSFLISSYLSKVFALLLLKAGVIIYNIYIQKIERIIELYRIDNGIFKSLSDHSAPIVCYCMMLTVFYTEQYILLFITCAFVGFIQCCNYLNYRKKIDN